MWCVETLVRINQEACRLAQEGKPERDALRNVGVSMAGVVSEGESSAKKMDVAEPNDK